MDGGYRSTETTLPKFNMAVMDVDGTSSIETVKLLLGDYKYLIHTTKRHTEQKNRFRLIMPISHILELNPKDYKEYMENVYAWLPFEVDTQTNDMARKWNTNDGDHFYNDGKLLDALLFIPKTNAAEKQKKVITDLQTLNNMERWFITQIGNGTRNNSLLKYSYLLVDSGFDIDTIRDRVLALNSKLEDSLEESEILSTIIISASKLMNENNTKGQS